MAVLLRDPFCPGYVDSIGNWNNGFACPPGEAEPLYCCGTATYRYCCPASVEGGTERGAAPVPANASSLLLILGIVFGVLVSTVLVVTALFFGWRTWRAHKKRPRTGGQLFCVAGGGTPSLYTGTFSRETSRLGSPQLGDDVLHTVDEVAVRQPYRFASPVSRPATTSFTANFGHRGESEL
ncbi:hypothetical protein FJT64_022794 [Amphibalanus amphitrite]|uniref:Shisa N-terminal domain-containing protein n=1 Tax=Amphibalanus amphitrite TaxID=1232801 RepID=A0A6A4WTY1_AMPAM|nr:hypothetical protein FJT64_011809 [Amphibalanus amphitrite]KAF0305541.1 hypothetical protein FJT64_022794 [Amphibalanus amphitrite]